MNQIISYYLNLCRRVLTHQVEVSSLNIDQQMNDVGEPFRLGHEIDQNIDLIFVDSILHRVGMDQIADVHVGIEPR